jgi:hypothetical protein
VIGEEGKKRKISDSTSATLINNLPATFPTDIDLDYYIHRAQALADTILHPRKRRNSSKAIEDPTGEERELYEAALTGTVVDVNKMRSLDIQSWMEKYATNYQFNYYKTMKSCLAGFCIASDGMINRAALAWFAESLDSAVG